MLFFPNAKINLGLHVTEKRADNYHNIETVFYPVNWCDALEITENTSGNTAFEFTQTGITIDGPTENNLVHKAWKLVKSVKNLPPLIVHLHKNIPMGAGLGGGSSDASFFINGVNHMFGLNLSIDERVKMASTLGSDCAFFIKNIPRYAEGRGDEFSGVRVDLSKYYILIVYPGIHSETAKAYNNLTPKKPKRSLRSFIEFHPVHEWKSRIANDFEASLFSEYPAITELKETLYKAGAVYASMSGSGSAVYGVFDKEPDPQLQANYKICLQKPSAKIL